MSRDLIVAAERVIVAGEMLIALRGLKQVGADLDEAGEAAAGIEWVAAKRDFRALASTKDTKKGSDA